LRLEKYFDIYLEPLLLFRRLYEDDVRKELNNMIDCCDVTTSSSLEDLPDHPEWKTFTFLHLCILKRNSLLKESDINFILDWGFPPCDYLKSSLFIRGVGQRIVDLPEYRNNFVVDKIGVNNKSSAFRLFLSRLSSLECLSVENAVMLDLKTNQITDVEYLVHNPFILSRDICDIVGLTLFSRKCYSCLASLSNLADEMFCLTDSEDLPSPFTPPLKEVDESNFLLDQPEGNYCVAIGFPYYPFRESFDWICRGFTLRKITLRDVTNTRNFNSYGSDDVRGMRKIFIMESNT